MVGDKYINVLYNLMVCTPEGVLVVVDCIQVKLYFSLEVYVTYSIMKYIEKSLCTLYRLEIDFFACMSCTLVYYLLVMLSTVPRH